MAGETSTGKPGVKSDKNLTNAEKTIFTMKELGLTIAIAESMTAGGLAYALTRVPGSSAVFQGGMITYTRATKSKFLGIPDEVLNHGLVSPEVTLAMARSVREKFGTHYGVGVTGNAGPRANEEGSSIGRVFIAICDTKGEDEVKQFDFFGGRDDVRSKALTDGLRMLRNHLERYHVEI